MTICCASLCATLETRVSSWNTSNARSGESSSGWPPASLWRLAGSFLPEAARLAQHVAAGEDCPGCSETDCGPEEADPGGVDDGIPAYRVAGKVQPCLELVRE